jgi:tetratricopeptide (TPR) repeat protein
MTANTSDPPPGSPGASRRWLACAQCGLLYAAPRPDESGLCPVCFQRAATGGPTAPVGRWFYARGKQKHGPLGRPELRRLGLAGQLRPDDMLLPEGGRTWVPAKSLDGLFPSAAVPVTDPAAASTAPDPQRRPPPAPPGPGRLPAVPGYELLGVLGRGGMGVVYKARHVQLKRLAALKMVLAGGHAQPEELARFRTEAEAVARLRHPNVVTIYEVGEHDGRPYFALEFIEGGTLAQRLAGTPLEAAAAARLTALLAAAMEAAHRGGIVHRDLKPQNVLLDGGRLDAPKVADFGLAKRLDDDSGQTRSGAVMGTPSYMAPEQAEGRLADIGPLSDVYALGAILYECLTGRPPFKGATLLDTLEQVRTREPVPPRDLQPSLPRDLETICLKCLQKEGGKRYASAQALADDLGRFLEGRPILARPAGAVERAGKFMRRNRLLVGGTVLVFVVLLGGIAATSWQRGAALDNLRRSLFDQGVLAAQQGKHADAIGAYDRALEAGYADAIDLRIRKVKSQVALDRRKEALAELAALRKLPLGRHEGEVLLLQGDLMLTPDTEAALALIREALAKGLPEADAAYARALLAEKSPEAIEYFRKAIELDHYHYQARHLLGMLLLFLGRVDEAERVAIESAALSPEDPAFQTLLALIDAFRGKEDDALRRLEKLRGRFGDQDLDMIRTGLGFIRDLHDWDGLLDLSEDVPSLKEERWKHFSGDVKKLLPWATGQLGKEAPQNVQEALRMPPLVSRGWGELLKTIAAINAEALDDETVDAVGRALEAHPEGMMQYLYAFLLFGRQRFEESEAAFLKAADMPSVASLRRPALLGAILAEVALLSREAGPRRQEATARAVRHMKEMLTFKKMLPWEAALMATIASRAGEHDLARALLMRGEEKARGDPGLARVRMQVEFAAGNYVKSLELAGAQARANPDDQMAAAVAAESLKRLRDIAGRQ